ncbi:hypothetical protein ANCDUO_17437 [Ancylostoma duodenale]|uniref:Uncharacterized protein n=1 Tax=Ancylostoma duodenale TaxID=51022 RepID=A0A0C2G5W7_9BILA|nr:hypothetical protein ANCDUO_17437 [Ancylostoma duodenale]
MKDDVLSQFISEPSAILNALYLGPLGAPTVEAFASGRSAEFRKQCRGVLAEVEVAMKSPEEFRSESLKSIMHIRMFYLKQEQRPIFQWDGHVLL